MSLETEKQTYEENLSEWTEHEGKYVLIKDSDVVDFFDTYADAINQGYKKFGLDPFFVKRVQRVEMVQFVTRLVAPSVG